MKSNTVSKCNISSNLEFHTITHYYKTYSLQGQVQDIKIANSQ